MLYVVLCWSCLRAVLQAARFGGTGRRQYMWYLWVACGSSLLISSLLSGWFQSGIYKLTCNDCQKAYVGQTGCDFYTRFNEHKRAFQYNTTQSKFTQHLLTHGHSFGNLENTMEIIQLQKKGTHLNTVERFHIHKEVITNNHLNEDYTETSNPIFNAILKLQ